jgi:hypothetical protein
MQKLFLFACLVLLTAAADKAEPQELVSELIHADLPLFGSAYTDKWPQHFTDSSNGEFGCTSRVKFGDWRLDSAAYGMKRADWYRVTNYGVFHCWANVVTASQRSDLNLSEVRPSFFVFLEKIGSTELWTLQMGARPGSDYLLLSRKPTDGVVSEFSVLQQKCPDKNRRDGKNIDILMTRYCAINDVLGLKSLARRMLKLKPLGTLTWTDTSSKESQ